jgi:Methyltransferase domain
MEGRQLTGSASAECRACGTLLVSAGRVVVRGQPADLSRCPSCGLHEFAHPVWLEAALSDPIADIDVGLASRCATLAHCTEAIIRAQGLGDRKHLDYGGGYGLLTRLLRDRGIDMRHYDPYATNLFAQGFEGQVNDEYGCVTLIEVFEHLVNPLDVIRSLREHTELILISTVLVPQARTEINDWWYVIPHLGQHVTFFTVPALQAIAAEAGMQLTSDGVGLHVLSRTRLRPLARLVVRKHRSAPLVAAMKRRRDGGASLTEADYATVTDRVNALARERDRAAAGAGDS